MFLKYSDIYPGRHRNSHAMTGAISCIKLLFLSRENRCVQGVFLQDLFSDSILYPHRLSKPWHRHQSLCTQNRKQPEILKKQGIPHMVLSPGGPQSRTTFDFASQSKAQCFREILGVWKCHCDWRDGHSWS